MEPVEHERRSGGREFQTVGAEKENERLPNEVRILGISSSLVSEERREKVAYEKVDIGLGDQKGKKVDQKGVF